jgi:DNA-binding transcriptional regulator YhcF (GntR family)
MTKTYSIDLPPFVSNFLDTATEEQKKFIIKELEKFLEKLRAEGSESKELETLFQELKTEQNV